MSSHSDIYGDQIQSALIFAKSGFDLTTLVDDEVTQSKRVPAGSVFEPHGDLWFVRTDSLPGHLAIKAIGVDAKCLYLETAPYDDDGVSTLIVEHMLPLRYDAEQGTVQDVTTGKNVIEIRRGVQATMGTKFSPRWLSVIPWATLDARRLDAAVRFMDLLYTNDSFTESGVVIEPTTVASQRGRQRLEMQLQLTLVQALKAEQRPVLSLQLTPVGIARMEQRLQPIMTLQARILAMTADELLAFLLEDLSPEGQRRNLEVLRFVLAGKIKGIKPELTWKEARRLARRLTNGGR